MSKIAINPQTATQVEKYLSQPSQAVVIIGPEMAGQDYIARKIAAVLLQVDSEKIDQSPGLILIKREADKKDISIDAIRQMITKVKLKAASNRVILIEQADSLSLEAQNSLLKTLEQPPAQTHFILTLSKPVLPTVMSRAEIINVRPINLAQALDHYHLPEAAVKAAWNMSEGAAELLESILSEKADNPAVDQAKQFITGTRYERLTKIDELAKDRQATLEFLDALGKVLKAVHHAQINKDLAAKSVNLLSARKIVDKAAVSVNANGSAKLALLYTVMNIKV
jgi:DNA polymerase III delta prime subunit